MSSLGTSVEANIEAIAAAIDGGVSDVPVGDALDLLAGVRGIVDAKEAQLLAARLESGATERSVESLLGKNKNSKRTAKTRARRAKAVKENPSIAKKMKTGELSSDQVDVIAGAAEKTDGAAAKDDELIDKVAAIPPDQAKKVADEWVREHTTAERVQDAYDRQRRLRCVKRWSTDRGTDVLALEGDTASIDKIELAIRNRSNGLYRKDGGRDVPSGKHQRTRDQRNFDAAIELLTRAGSADSGTAAGDKTQSKTSRSAEPGPRSAIVVTMTADQATGVDLSPVRQVGGGLLAPSVLAAMFCGADLVGEVVDPSGQVLWQGHTKRSFTDEQVLALIARDQGCVLCRAHYSMCDAHHIIPTESPARGPTDIDNGALLCSDCHHRVHAHELTLVRDPDTGTWTTRPALPQEIAPKRTTDDRVDEPPGRARAERSKGPKRGEHKPRLHERPRTGALW